MSDVLSVEYFHEIPGVGYGNIMWLGKYPMRGGRFPADHPVGRGAPGDFGMECHRGERMEAFRARGYWASCFPEGDGITMKTEAGQTAAQVARDIEEVFGWNVTIKRGDTDDE